MDGRGVHSLQPSLAHNWRTAAAAYEEARQSSIPNEPMAQGTHTGESAHPGAYCRDRKNGARRHALILPARAGSARASAAPSTGLLGGCRTSRRPVIPARLVQPQPALRRRRRRARRNDRDRRLLRERHDRPRPPRLRHADGAAADALRGGLHGCRLRPRHATLSQFGLQGSPTTKAPPPTSKGNGLVSSVWTSKAALEPRAANPVAESFAGSMPAASTSGSSWCGAGAMHPGATRPAFTEPRSRGRLPR